LTPTDSIAPFPDAFTARLIARDAKAWEDAFRRLWPVALRVAGRVLPPPPVDAEDIASATLADFSHRPSVPSTWSQCAALVAVMARRRAISHLRHQHRQKRAAHNTDPLDDQIRNAAASPDDSVAAALDLDTVLDKLAPLPRQILEAHFVDGLNSNEIGQRLNLNPATVRSHLSRTLQLLRRTKFRRET
jgi:RNA polymerase sigma factor (sigma-70 family)